MIYLDNAATTKPCPAAVTVMTEALVENWGNPSAVHGLGLRAEKAVKTARVQVAEALGCGPERVFFTSGGTEGDNFALFAAARRYGKRGKHIITTAAEHHAVLNAAKDLEAQGFVVTYLPTEPDGSVTKEALRNALRKDTILVSLMMVNNETGAVNDIAGLAKLTHQRSGAIFHTDAVQGFLKIPFRAASQGADVITVSGHKIGGPKGVGAVFLRETVDLPPLIYGGGQERLGQHSMRSGTENVPGILGFGAACASRTGDLREKQAAMGSLRDMCLAELAEMPEVQVLPGHQAPHILSLSVPGVLSEHLIRALEAREIYVSAGSACARGHRSHVLEALALPPEVIDGSIRVSLGFETTRQEVESFLRGFRDALSELM